jgi:capsular exopolysaccharide synthesis family protein
MIPAETIQTTVPHVAPGARLASLAEPRSAAAEQYRVLYQRLLRLAARRPTRVVAITSPGLGEGRTTTAANLALTAAQEGRSAILVEADLRRPSLSRLLGLAPRPGLLEVLAGTAELGQAVARFSGLAVLCAGEAREEPGGDAAGRSPRAAGVMDALRAAYDHVYLDAPPAMAFADGDRLVAEADAVVLVVRAGITPRKAIRAALEALGERAAGIVVNDADPASGEGRWLHVEAEGPAPGRRKVGSA